MLTLLVIVVSLLSVALPFHFEKGNENDVCHKVNKLMVVRVCQELTYPHCCFARVKNYAKSGSGKSKKW